MWACGLSGGAPRIGKKKSHIDFFQNLSIEKQLYCKKLQQCDLSGNVNHLNWDYV